MLVSRHFKDKYENKLITSSMPGVSDTEATVTMIQQLRNARIEYHKTPSGFKFFVPKTKLKQFSLSHDLKRVGDAEGTYYFTIDAMTCRYYRVRQLLVCKYRVIKQRIEIDA